MALELTDTFPHPGDVREFLHPVRFLPPFLARLLVIESGLGGNHGEQLGRAAAPLFARPFVFHFDLEPKRSVKPFKPLI